MEKNIPPLIEQKESKAGQTAKETYNIVSDTVVGINARKSDNLLQVKITIITIVIGAIIGVIFDGDAEVSEQLPSHLQHLVKEPVLKVALGVVGLENHTGLVAGAFAGIILGFLGSGFYLMVFRAVKHASGEHE
tara:strand:- start:89 stop:490 length:402 start_codon:yes stop_codon:yes gene_type:complete